jgi:rare lipoprotein A
MSEQSSIERREQLGEAVNGPVSRRTARLRLSFGLVLLSLSTFLAGCAARSSAPTATTRPTKVFEVREGLASYYGQAFHGRRSASGVRFDMNAMVAAHPSYPFGTLVRVTNLRNGRSVRVRIQDRGPAARPRAEGVIIDLSRGAAQKLGFLRAGRTRVRLEVLGWGRTRSRR